MQSTEPAQPVTMSAPDEIDLVELLAILWRQRLWMGGGLAVGAVLGILYFAVAGKSFKSPVPVTLDTKSLPALNEPKAVETAFQSALGTRENAKLFFNEVLATFKDPSDEAARKELVLDMVRSQVPTEAGKKRSSKFGVTFTYVAGQGDFSAEVVLPMKGSGDELGMAVVRGLNAVAENYNRTALAARRSEAEATEKEALEGLRKEQSNRTQGADEATQDQMKVRGEISAMVAKLQKKAPGTAPRDGNLFAPMMLTAEGKAGEAGNTGYSMVQPDYVEERLDVLRASRLIGVLQDSGSLSQDEARALEMKLAELSRRSMDLEASSRAQAGMRQSLLERIAQARLKMAATKSPTDLPLMRGDEEDLKSLYARGRFEQRSPSPLLLLVGGAFLGLFAGLFAGLGISFVRHNQKRLAALSQGDLPN